MTRSASIALFLSALRLVLISGENDNEATVLRVNLQEILEVETMVWSRMSVNGSAWSRYAGGNYWRSWYRLTSRPILKPGPGSHATLSLGGDGMNVTTRLELTAEQFSLQLYEHRFPVAKPVTVWIERVDIFVEREKRFGRGWCSVTGGATYLKAQWKDAEGNSGIYAPRRYQDLVHVTSLLHDMYPMIFKRCEKTYAPTLLFSYRYIAKDFQALS